MEIKYYFWKGINIMYFHSVEYINSFLFSYVIIRKLDIIELSVSVLQSLYWFTMNIDTIHHCYIYRLNMNMTIEDKKSGS